MSRSTCLALALSVSVAAGACSLAVPPPAARVRRGPAFATSPARMLVLPVACDGRLACNPNYRSAVAGGLHMSLELTLIDAEVINARLGDRRVSRREVSHGGRTSVSESATTERVVWGQAAPGEQAALLAEMQLDGILAPSIWMGPARGMAQQRTIQVALRAVRVGGTLAWTSRCAVETGDFHSTEQALAIATRCSLDAVGAVRER